MRGRAAEWPMEAGYLQGAGVSLMLAMGVHITLNCIENMSGIFFFI